TTNPSITCPGNFSVQCAADVPAAYGNLAAFITAGGTASDNCDTNLSFALVSDTGLVGGSCGGIFTRIYSVTDDCNNSASCTQVITVHDTIAPVLDPCPVNITVNASAGACSAVVTFTLPGANDNCDSSPTVVADPPSGYEFPSGTTTVTITATDDCNNSSQCT